MEPTRWNEIEKLFHQALEVPSDRREAFVAQSCRDDADLFREVMSLLEAERRCSQAEESGLSESVFRSRASLFKDFKTRLNDTPLPQEDSLIGQKIGSFQLVRLIGAGGMGLVYEGVQENPRRPVAVKILRSRLASSDVKRRFQVEAQILGRLRHPNIAVIHEAGLHREGPNELPYFVLEYIPDAQPLTLHADERGLGLPARLKLFAPICEAVHHAHEQSIIHRDLKPANILVGADGLPKVIDFGVARSSGLGVGETMITQEGNIMGTPHYMSPEQATGRPETIDARTDVYALGVVLYELVTGRKPFELHDKSLFEAARVIREQPPVKPSAFNPTLPPRLNDLILQAIAKNPKDRFQSAEAMARAIRDLIEFLATSPPHRAGPFRWKRLVPAAGLATLAGAAWIGWIWNPSNSPEPPALALRDGVSRSDRLLRARKNDVDTAKNELRAGDSSEVHAVESREEDSEDGNCAKHGMEVRWLGAEGGWIIQARFCGKGHVDETVTLALSREGQAADERSQDMALSHDKLSDPVEWACDDWGLYVVHASIGGEAITRQEVELGPREGGNERLDVELEWSEKDDSYKIIALLEGGQPMMRVDFCLRDPTRTLLRSRRFQQQPLPKANARWNLDEESLEGYRCDVSACIMSWPRKRIQGTYRIVEVADEPKLESVGAPAIDVPARCDEEEP